MPNPTPTDEQSAIIQSARHGDSLMVEALAGAAKTTTLTMVAEATPGVGTLAAAFNKKIAVELERRLPPTFTVKTLNGLGHSAWARAIGRRPELDERKLGKLVTQCAKAQGSDLTTDQWDGVRRLVSMAMAQGLVPAKWAGQGLVEDSDDNWQAIADELWVDLNPALLALARTVLAEDIKLGFAGVISFDDQVYLSTMFNGLYQRFPRVLVDEAQDLSPLNHIQLQRSAADGILAVGDPLQAIYAFRGADARSMLNLRRLRPQWTDLPLATTFRCPKRIVARQLAHAPRFRAWHANPDGAVERFPRGQGWGWPQVDTLAEGRTIAVLCRNNAPLLALAFKLIRRGVGVTMLGRDIGKSLVALSRKIIPQDTTPASSCAAAIRDWAEREASKARANQQLDKLDGIEDRAECLQATLDGSQARDAGALRAALERLFGRESGKVTLSTIHRAKGLEWGCVVHLDPWRVPSKQAQKRAAEGDLRAMGQEMNLRYVAETRSQHTLIEADLEDFQ